MLTHIVESGPYADIVVDDENSSERCGSEEFSMILSHIKAVASPRVIPMACLRQQKCRY
jgi:hypothetical protein